MNAGMFLLLSTITAVSIKSDAGAGCDDATAHIDSHGFSLEGAFFLEGWRA
jgi:hypothetical protein